MQNPTTNGCPGSSNAGKRENGGTKASALPRFHARTILAAGLFLAASITGWSQEARDPLLDLMIQKGMLTQEEAAKVKAEADAMRTNAPAPSALSSSKWKLSDGLKHIELYGDIRVRYEDRSAEDPQDAQVRLQRARYAIRLGLRGDAFDDYYYGLRLETGANGRSPWVTLGSSTTASPIYQGPFGKSTAGMNIGQAYIGGRWGDWLDVTAGKMPNPIYTTPMVWDTDLSPEGLAERFKYKVGQADFFATLGQFLYLDTNPTEYSSGFFGYNTLYPSDTGGSSSLAFMLAWQAGVNYHFTPDISLKAAPVLYNYLGQPVDTTMNYSGGANPTGLVAPGFGDTFVGQGATSGVNGPAYGWSGYPNGYNDGFNANQTGINDLLVLEIPWEFNFKIAKLNARVFGDYAVNLDGRDRAQAAYVASQTAGTPNGFAEVGGVRPISSPQTRDIHAYQVGLALGNKDSLGLVYGTVSKKHAWEVRTYWQHIEQYALDPNLLDSDFFEGRGNLEGVYAAVAYGFSDNMIGTFRYGYASRINSQLGTGGSNQDIPQVNPIQQYHLLQFDLTFKF